MQILVFHFLILFLLLQIAYLLIKKARVNNILKFYIV